MAGITLAQAEAKLSEWMTAEEVLQTCQSYTLSDGSQVTKADLDKIGRRIEYWNKMTIRLSRGGIRISGGTPT
jgi:hypothetical protein